MTRNCRARRGRLARLAGGAAVIDLACGTGVSTSAILAALGPAGTVTAVGASAKMLAAAAAAVRDRRMTWTLGRAEELDAVAPGPADAVVCNSAIWPADAGAAFAAAARVLAPGGRLAFNVTSHFLGEAGPGRRWT
jgi:ubiquinone/menaquinone biosynthesis C-methylase UbiE